MIIRAGADRAGAIISRGVRISQGAISRARKLRLRVKIRAAAILRRVRTAIHGLNPRRGSFRSGVSRRLRMTLRLISRSWTAVLRRTEFWRLCRTALGLKTGDIVRGSRRIKSATEKFAALLYINSVNNYPTNVIERRPNFENLTPIFPNRRLHLEMPGTKNSTAMRVMDLLSPIGKGQRGMIVSPPKAGKTTLLKQVARAVTTNHPEMHLIILLIDERPEEVTDIKEAIGGPNVEVIYSTFDELPDRHKRVSEMVIERAKRLVEHGRDVMILLDSITRLARAYNLVVPPSGRTLSGGLDPAALHMPKRFFGAARNMREGGSLTILATALIDTGSRMDDVIYEEFKGTGNMELVLDRKLSERRIFPAIDILGSGTRRDDLLLSQAESEAVDLIHKATNVQRPEETVERILNQFANTSSNKEFVEISRKRRYF